jgi:glutamate 5-kinase
MAFSYSDNGERQAALEGVRRVVIKVGTRLLTEEPSSSKASRIEELVDQIAQLRARGIEVILVSSGAIGAGMKILKTAKRPTSLPRLQAHAAVGQSRLMFHYETACIRHGFHCGQLLLTADDVKNRERHLNVSCCMDRLLQEKVLPIVNENDSVSVEEIKFGDNDMLAAMVANMVQADLTILLTSVNGMLERTPGGKLGQRLSVVRHLTPALRKMGAGTDGNEFSTGGMATKLSAAKLVTGGGDNLWIADGRDFGVLARLFAGEDIGTLFQTGKERRLHAHKRYLAFFSKPKGEIIIDSGAEEAVCRHGSSLLPSGITAVTGSFKRGETILLLNENRQELGRGVSNYSNGDIVRIRGQHTRELKHILGHEAYNAVVHRNYLVMTE